MNGLVAAALGVVGLVVICSAAAAAVSRTPEILAGLFRSSDRLDWPVGVQEEDLPPAFGSRFPARDDPPRADDQPRAPAAPLEPPAALELASDTADGGLERPRDVRVRGGSARR